MRDIIQAEAVEKGLLGNNCTLVLPVRTGKCKVGLEIAKSFTKVLIAYPNNSILESWKNDAIKFNYDTSKIIFTTFLSLDKHKLDDFDLVIIDEVQDFSIGCWEYLTGFTIKKLICLTATPPNKGEKKVFLDKYAPIVYERSLDETTGILQKDYTITVHFLEPSNEKNIPLKSGKFWSEKAKIGFWEGKYSISRNFQDMLRLIQSIQNSKTKLDYVKELSSKLDRCIIFLETTSQCDNLPYYSYHSKDKTSEDNLKAFQEGTVSHLTCVKQLSAGISFKNLNKCIILHTYSSNNKAHQRLGRVLNMIDNSEKVAEIHVICLNNTRDLKWTKEGLSEFDQNKIEWKKVN